MDRNFRQRDKLVGAVAAHIILVCLLHCLGVIILQLLSYLQTPGAPATESIRYPDPSMSLGLGLSSAPNGANNSLLI